jgi:hypothetical protein
MSGDRYLSNDRLESICALQIEAATATHADPRLLVDIEERIQYVKDMVLACTDELHEVLKEMSWKPWAQKQFINEDAAFGELRDALQFVLNAMFAVTQLNPPDLADKIHVEHAKKVIVNLERARNGEAPKCAMCGRALDDEATIREVIAVSTSRVDIHCVCGAYLGSRAV